MNLLPYRRATQQIPNTARPWRVVDRKGVTISQHRTSRDADAEARRLNSLAGVTQPQQSTRYWKEPAV
jgi:hypothetical protein